MKEKFSNLKKDMVQEAYKTPVRWDQYYLTT